MINQEKKYELIKFNDGKFSLDVNEVDLINNTHFLRVVDVKQKIAFYSLNVIISVGYRVKSNYLTKDKLLKKG